MSNRNRSTSRPGRSDDNQNLGGARTQNAKKLEHDAGPSGERGTDGAMPQAGPAIKAAGDKPSGTTPVVLLPCFLCPVDDRRWPTFIEGLVPHLAVPEVVGHVPEHSRPADADGEEATVSPPGDLTDTRGPRWVALAITGFLVPAQANQSIAPPGSPAASRPPGSPDQPLGTARHRCSSNAPVRDDTTPIGLADQIRVRWPRARYQAPLVEFMENRHTATVEEIAEHIYGDQMTSSGAIEQLALRTNDSLMELQAGFKF